ncbi:mutt/nudix family protein-like protein [Leishmania tarentolae]|uniref:Mutt/nudix family protein-like protein n=1 Tax=Leishmania tarentolae TaxID=5689 RepID=A0A640KPV8_LEITA|nr:mutt/nudix family protein-like protein [Leishmania tarentolae]
MSRLLEFTLSGGQLRRLEQERMVPGFQNQRLQPSHRPRVVIVKKENVGFVPRAQRQPNVAWWHHSLCDGSLSVKDLKELIYVGEDPQTGENIFSSMADNLSGRRLSQLVWAPSKHGDVLEMSRPEQAAYGLAVSLVRWNASNRFCAKCGTATDPTRDVGFSRFCPPCRKQHFPQLMPAVLVAVLDGKGNVILSQRRKKSKVLTLLSGFVLHGESAEEAVRREVEEESGARVSEVRYIGSQPWPYPYLMMMCYYAVADSSPSLVVEASELENVMWVSKQDVRRALEGGGKGDIELLGPGTTPYAMLKPWVDGEVDDRGRFTALQSQL